MKRTHHEPGDREQQCASDTTHVSPPVLSLLSPSSSTYDTSLGPETPADQNPPSHLPFLSSTPHLSPLPPASALPLFLSSVAGNTKMKPLGKLPLHPASAEQLEGSENIS